MGKSSSVFVCNECGYESAKWLGKCPACNTWNTFFEQKVVKDNGKSGLGKEKQTRSVSPSKLNTVVGKDAVRTSTGFEELDRVLGGGIVKGSLVLLRRRTRNW